MIFLYGPTPEQADKIAKLEAIVKQLADQRKSDVLRQETLIQSIFPKISLLDSKISLLDSKVTQLDDKTASAAAQERLAADVCDLRREVSGLRVWGPQFDSQIISYLPELFEEFRLKRFVLLWRGSRDGLNSHAFHSRCDGHGNTVLLILDTNGNIFGGFTPVK
jgi:hypothetical protein